MQIYNASNKKNTRWSLICEWSTKIQLGRCNPQIDPVTRELHLIC